MKNICFTLGLALVCGFSFGQQKTPQQYGEGISAVWHNNVATEKGATISSEDFATGIPTTWTNVTVSGPVDWKHTTDGHSGAYPTSAIASTTSGNGWLIVDSDADNFSGGGVEDAQITTPIIDCSGFAQVKLEFQQMFRRWQADVTTVRVTTDGGANWTDFILNTAITQAGTDNPDYVNINITSAIAGDPANVQIQFWWQGAWDYGWQIDDVAIKEIDPNDIIVKRASFDADVEYYQIPMSQTQTQQYHARVQNIGYADQTNVQLSVDINDGASSIFTGISNTIPTLAVGAEDSLGLSITFTPSSLGTYTVTYSGSQTETDDDTTNNDKTASFAVTDTVYAIDNGIYGGQWWNQNSGGTGSDPYEIASLFEIVNNDKTTTTTVFVGDSTDIGAVFYVSLYVYDPVDQLFDLVNQTDDYVVTSNDLNNWVTLPWFNNELLTGGSDYICAVRHYGGSERVFIGYGTNSSFSGTTLSNDGASGAWSNQPRTPMIRLNVNQDLSIFDHETEFLLNQNIPNPAKDMTTINYSLNSNAVVSFSITDISGKEVLSVIEGAQNAGVHAVNLNTSSFSSGTYFYTISVNGKGATRKMIVE